MEIRELDRETIDYRTSQFNKLKNNWDYEVGIKFFGSEAGQTNQLSISKEEYFYIMDYLTGNKKKG
jgi:hypothetical protein